MKHNKLTIEEVKDLQIDLLIDFDRFCKDNNITYYLAYGTLLGAIRHKGYIPWDDDIDVMVPQPEIQKIKELYKSEKYKIADVDNEPNYEFSFPRLVDTRTYKKVGIIARQHGVFIDIYPIDAYPNNVEERNKYIRKLRKKIQITKKVVKLMKIFFRILPINTFPIIKYFIRNEGKFSSCIPYSTATHVQIANTRIKPIPKEVFKFRCEVEFENHLFYAPKDWDTFLRHSYDDYMKLPPEDKRHPYHGTNKYYWK